MFIDDGESNEYQAEVYARARPLSMEGPGG